MTYMVFMVLKFTNMSHEINETIEEATRITQVGIKARLTFSIAQEIIASRSVSKDITSGGESFFDKYKSDSYKYLNNLLILEKSELISHSHEELETKVNQIIFQNFCLYYLKPFEGLQCDQQLLNVGLETVTTFILEKSTELLSQFRNSNQDKLASISLINGETFSQLELFSELSYKAY